MQFLGGPPGATTAVFAEMIYHQSHVLQMTDARFRMTKPETLRITANQCHCPLAQFRRRRRGRRKFAQLVRLGSHENNLETVASQSKEPLPSPTRQKILCRILPAVAV